MKMLSLLDLLNFIFNDSLDLSHLFFYFILILLGFFGFVDQNVGKSTNEDWKKILWELLNEYFDVRYLNKFSERRKFTKRTNHFNSFTGKSQTD